MKEVINIYYSLVEVVGFDEFWRYNVLIDKLSSLSFAVEMLKFAIKAYPEKNITIIEKRG